MGVCAYIVSCEETKLAAIIDPGGDEDKLLDACKANDLQVKYIIATHGHPDHVCGNGPIKEATNAEIIMHEADETFFSDPEMKNYFSMLGLAASPPADITVKHDDIIEFGTVKLTVIHTPGHTPGGMCLYSAPHCFTGDTLFVAGVGRTDFPGGSMEELSRSIRNQLLTLPADTIVWPGHGYGGSQSTIEREASSNPYF